MWRWLIPVGLASAAALQMIFLTGAHVDGYGNYAAGAVTLTWLVLMITAIPTILLYRLLIAAGERVVPRWPRTGAAVLVLAAALLPPFVYNRWTAAENTGRNFSGPVPTGVDTIAIEGTDLPREALQLGIAPCGDPCLRLLFGGGARRVVLGNPDARMAVARRGRGGPGELSFFSPAPILHLERRPLCPPVLTESVVTYGTPYAGKVRIGPPIGRDEDPDMAERALALIAAGHCPIAESGRFADAQLVLGAREGGGSRLGRLPQPGGAGTIGYRYRFIDRRDGSGWTRIGQQIDVLHVRHWTYPFAFLKGRRGWIAATVETTAGSPTTLREIGQPWVRLGFTLPDVPETDWRAVREMLEAALALPPAAPLDARHQLGPQYLRALARRPVEAADRALAPRLIADPRIPVDDLQRLRGIDASLAAPALFARIRRPDSSGGDLRSLVHIAHDLRGGDRQALLALLRELNGDPERGDDIGGQLRQYEAEERPRPTPVRGGVAPADFGFSHGQRPGPVAVALDIAALVLCHLALLWFALRHGRRARKDLPETEVPVQATP